MRHSERNQHGLLDLPPDSPTYLWTCLSVWPLSEVPPRPANAQRNFLVGLPYSRDISSFSLFPFLVISHCVVAPSQECRERWNLHETSFRSFALVVSVIFCDCVVRSSGLSENFSLFGSARPVAGHFHRCARVSPEGDVCGSQRNRSVTSRTWQSRLQKGNYLSLSQSQKLLGFNHWCWISRSSGAQYIWFSFFSEAPFDLHLAPRSHQKEAVPWR